MARRAGACWAVVMLAGIMVAGGLPAQAQRSDGPEAAPWRFVSIPDFLNNDVAYPEPRWDDALDYVLRAIQAEDPAFVLVAGDMVMGRWSQSPEHLRSMADRYYTAWVDRMAAYGLTTYVAVGDHEMGDDPWPAEKAALIPEYRRAFEAYLAMPENGPPGFRRRAYRVVHENLLLITLDVFETDAQGAMRIGVTGEQLAWFEATLQQHRASVQHVVVMAHVPVLPGARERSSSRLTLPEGAASDLWRVAAQYGVDLYLCGEMHAVSMQQQDGIVQVVHGSQPSNVNEFNYLLVTVYPDRLDLALKRIRTTLEGPRDKGLDPFGVDPYQGRTVRIRDEDRATGFRTIGTMRIEKQGGGKQIVDRKGAFVEHYTVLDSSSTGREEEPGNDAGGFRLEYAFPNPAQDYSTVRFTAGEAQPVRAELINLLGQPVAMLFDGYVAAGQVYTLHLATQDLPRGVYVIRLEGHHGAAIRKLVVR